MENGLELFSKGSGLWEMAVVFLLCPGFQFPVWVKHSQGLLLCVGVWHPGLCSCSLCPGPQLLHWLQALASGTNVPQHRYTLLLEKCCIISLTQKHSCLNLRLCILLFSIPTWVPVSPGLGHGLRAKVQLHKQPSAPVHPKANPGLTLPPL